MSDWYLDATYSECKDIIKANLSNISQSFIAIGFYLKRVRDKELFKTDGYKDIWEFALDQYGIQRSTASRWMAMNDRFSKDGNSPILQEKYKLFGKSQLQEILYLPEEKLEEITPEMTVKEIRESRKPETCATSHISALGFPLREYPENSLIQSKGCGKLYTCDSCSQNKCDIRQEKRWCVEAPCGNPFSCTTMEVTESLKKEVGEKCQFVNHELAYHRTGDKQPAPCCKECETPCGYECCRSVENRKSKRDMGILEKELKIPENIQENKEDAIGVTPHDSNISPETSRGQTKILGETDDRKMILTFAVEAVMEEFDLETLKTSCETADQFRGELQDILFAEEIKFRFRNRKMMEDFYSVVEVMDVETDEKIAEYSWEEFFAELERQKKNNKRYETEQAEKTENLKKDNLSVIQNILREEENNLQEYIDCEKTDGPLPENLMMRQKILVEALRNFYEGMYGKQEEHVQPELPTMKNNDQRKEWLRNYRDWGLWYEDEHIGAKYYRYEFENGAVLIAEEYECSNEFVKNYTSSYLHLVGGPESAKGVNGVGKWQTHEKYSRYPNSETELVEFLKEIQK